MRFHLVVFVAAATSLASIATAQVGLISAAAEPIAQIMQDVGLAADVTVDSSGDPLILSSASGAQFAVLFYGCAAGKNCTSVQFNACFDLPNGTKFDVMNKWNKDMRYGKASLNDEMDPCLMMDIDMTAGTAPDTFRSSLKSWSQILGQFNTVVGF